MVDWVVIPIMRNIGSQERQITLLEIFNAVSNKSYTFALTYIFKFILGVKMELIVKPGLIQFLCNEGRSIVDYNFLKLRFHIEIIVSIPKMINLFGKTKFNSEILTK